MAEQTMDKVIIKFEGNVTGFSEGSDKLITILENLQKALGITVEGMAGLDTAVEETGKHLKGLKDLNKQSKETTKSFAKLFAGTTAAFKKMMDMTQASADFVNSQIKFNSVFDKTNGELDKAKKFVDEYSSALYLDSQQVMDAVSNFKLLAGNIGFSSEEATKMSTNLTQLAYDLAAVKNVDVSEAMTALSSGLGGEAEAMKRFGVMLNQQTLQTTLYAKGFDRTVASLNAVERATLTYYQMMTVTAGQQGYLAKTMETPARAIQTIKTQFTVLSREIGNVFIPILMALYPYILALTQLLRNLAVTIANFFGINIDFDAVNEGIGNISGGIGGIGENADKTSKKVKEMLRDFDELHVVDFGDQSGSGITSGAGGGNGLSSLLEELKYADYNQYLSQFSGKIEEIIGKLKQWIPLILAVAAGLALWKIAKLVTDISEFVKLMVDNHPFVTFFTGLTLIAGGTLLALDGVSKLMDGEINLASITETLVGVLAIFVGSMLVIKALDKLGILKKQLGFPDLLKKATGVTAIMVVVVAVVGAVKKALEEGEGAATALGIALGAMAVAGVVVGLTLSPLLGTILLIAAGVLYLVGAVQTVVQAFQSFWDADVEVKMPMENIGNNIKSLGDTIHEAFGGAEEDVDNFKDSILNTSLVSRTSTTNMVNGIDTDLNTILKGALDDSELDLKEYGVDANTVFTNLEANTGIKFGNIYDIIKTTTSNANTDGTTNMNNLETNYCSSLTTMETNTKTTMGTIDTNIDDTITNVEDYLRRGKREIEAFGKTKVATPHFSWTETIGGFLDGNLKNLFGKIGWPALDFGLRVDYYEGGGFPRKGDLFVANETAPELIGSMGNRNVVANNAQITEGIAQASYSGMKRALAEVGIGGGDTYVYVGNKQLTDVVTKRQRSDNQRFGR